MKTVLTAGLTKDDKAELEASFNASLLFRRRLVEVLSKELESSRNAMCNKEGYSDANWAYSMADSLGYQRALRKAISIIT